MKYFLIVIFFLLLIDIFVYRLIVSKKWYQRMLGTFCSCFFLILMFLFFFYGKTTMDFLKNSFQSREQILNYQVLVLNNSNYGSLKEFKNGKIGVPFAKFSPGASLLQNEIKKKTSLTLQECDNSTLVESLLQKNFRVIVMEEAQKNLFMEINDKFASQVKVLETIPITIKNQVKKRDSNLLKKPFSIYVSGNDDYGVINQVSRSDVNMVLTINPLTHRILITSIPRDYYVELTNMENEKDKLTHASLYGIETSMKTLENLLQTEISYYVKINFSSLVNLVEAVDGVDVESDVSFTANYYDEPVKGWVTYSYQKGWNHLNGKEALAFARERHSFALGDRERAYHQQLIISALIDKISSPAILKNYTNILNALNGSFDTNFHYEDILSVLQNQLDNNAKWEISTNILEGTDGNKKVYSMPGVTTYVMIPSEESISNAILKIKDIMS